MLFIQKSLAAWLLISGASSFAHEPQASAAVNISEITSDPSCVFELGDNPFAWYESGPFPYDQLRVEHFEPAFENGLAVAKRRLAQLQRDHSKPLFANTVEEIEKLGEPFQRVLTILETYAKVKSSPEILGVKARIMAQVEAFNLDVWSDPHLRTRVEVVKEQGPLLKLTREENTLLHKTRDQMISLSPEKLARLKEINARLVQLSLQPVLDEMLQLRQEGATLYFSFENVLKGAFFAANQLFGVEFVERTDMPKWDPSVRTFEVLDRTKQHLAYYYFDPFPRDGKREGAFTDELIRGGSFRWGKQRPHVVSVANVTSPNDGQPALLSLTNVITIFHEMGNGLHSALSQTKYTSLFGQAVAWDAVELPAKIFEKFAFAPEVLDVYARHYETGEKLPSEMVEKLKASRNVGVALDGLYSEYWAEVLAADIDEMFQENGRFDPTTAGLLQLHIMEAGGSEPVDVLFRRLRGRDPDPLALLRAHGVLR